MKSLPQTGTAALLESLSPYLDDDVINDLFPKRKGRGRRRLFSAAQLFRVLLLNLVTPVHSFNLLVKLLAENRSWRSFAHLRNQRTLPNAKMLHLFRERLDLSKLRAISIDLMLENRERRIACEISISTTVDQEVGNIAKCARAGFDEIAMVSTTENRLKKIEGAVEVSLGPDIAKRVGYFLPDAFIERLRSAPLSIPPQPSEPAVVERRGYKVKRALAGLSPSDQKAREEEAIRAMSEAMRKKQKQ